MSVSPSSVGTSASGSPPSRRAIPRIAALPGDGIGPEVMEAALQVLQAVGEFDVRQYAIGAVAIDRTGVPLPPETLAACTDSDAVLLGAVGLAAPPTDPTVPRPEQGVLELRKALGLYANLRPVRPFPALIDAGPLKPERTKDVDLIVVRELTGGLYFGPRGSSDNDAFDTCTYTVEEIERVTRVACELATRTGRRSHVTSVDKANVLNTSRLWRQVVQRVVEQEFAHITLDHLLVDTAAMRLVTDPASFDVILTENMFGDILSDETAAITGSIGLLPSASLPGPPALAGGIRGGLFEPVHGSAPDIAGRSQASPLGMVLSVALMLRHGLGLSDAADVIEAAVDRVLGDGLRTPDLGGAATTTATTSAVLAAL